MRVDAHARRMLIPRSTRTCSVYENSPSIVILGYDFLSLHSSDNATPCLIHDRGGTVGHSRRLCRVQSIHCKVRRLTSDDEDQLMNTRVPRRSCLLILSAHVQGPPSRSRRRKMTQYAVHTETSTNVNAKRGSVSWSGIRSWSLYTDPIQSVTEIWYYLRTMPWRTR